MFFHVHWGLDGAASAKVFASEGHVVEISVRIIDGPHAAYSSWKTIGRDIRRGSREGHYSSSIHSRNVE